MTNAPDTKRPVSGASIRSVGGASVQAASRAKPAGKTLGQPTPVGIASSSRGGRDFTLKELLDKTRKLSTNLSDFEREQGEELKLLRAKVEEILCLLNVYVERQEDAGLGSGGAAVWQVKYKEALEKGEELQSALTELDRKLASVERELTEARKRREYAELELSKKTDEVSLSLERVDELKEQLEQLKQTLVHVAEKATEESTMLALMTKQKTELSLRNEQLSNDRQKFIESARREAADALKPEKIALEQKVNELQKEIEFWKKAGRGAAATGGSALGTKGDAERVALERRVADAEARVQETEQNLANEQQFCKEVQTELSALRQQLGGAPDANRIASRNELCTAMKKVTKSIWACTRSLLQGAPSRSALAAISRDAKDCESDAMLADILFEGFESDSFLSKGSACLYGRAERCVAYERAYQAFDEPHAAKPAGFGAFAAEKNELLRAKIRGGRTSEFEIHWAEALRNVYALHLLALSFAVPPRLIRRQQGDPFDEKFCEPDSACFEVDGQSKQTVAFTVYPWFYLLDQVVPGLKCQVYLESTRPLGGLHRSTSNTLRRDLKY